MADNGIIIIGNQTIGYTERQTYIYWDISPDMSDERNVYIKPPYYLVNNNRYAGLNYVLSIYTTRWTGMEYEPVPMSERTIFLYYSQCIRSERTTYYYPETGNRLVFVEGLLTNTPLLMKYPKYFNWNYVPQILNPEFILWSFYPLSTSDITVKLMSTTGISVSVNSGVEPDKFTITTLSNNQYKIVANVDQTFPAGDHVSCYITAYDSKGNYLKPGMW
jgi:hypothetical protein